MLVGWKKEGRVCICINVCTYRFELCEIPPASLTFPLFQNPPSFLSILFHTHTHTLKSAPVTVTVAMAVVGEDVNVQKALSRMHLQQHHQKIALLNPPHPIPNSTKTNFPKYCWIAVSLSLSVSQFVCLFRCNYFTFSLCWSISVCFDFTKHFLIHPLN